MILLLGVSSMGKCIRCGRKGFFLKTHNGVCENCLAIIRTEEEISTLTEQRESLQKEVATLQNVLSDEKAVFEKIRNNAKAAAIKEAETEMAAHVAKTEQAIERNKEKAAEAEARQVVALREEQKAIKNAQSIDKKLLKYKSLLSAIQNAIDMSATDYPVSPEEISKLATEVENSLSPSVTLELQCLGMRDLRKRYRANEKCIEDVLSKYKDRYTTKANITIYSLTVIALKAELQNILFNLKFGNLEKSIKQLKEVTQKYYLITADGNQSIAPTMRKFIC